MTTTTNLWRVLDEHADRSAGYFQQRVTSADMARATGLSEQVLSKWKRRRTLPKPEHLAMVSAGLGIPYKLLLEAALKDKGYLPEPGLDLTSAADAEAEEMLGSIVRTDKGATQRGGGRSAGGR